MSRSDRAMAEQVHTGELVARGASQQPFSNNRAKKRDISMPNVSVVRSEGGRICCDFNGLSKRGNTDADNIEPCLIELAASKVEDIDEKFAPKFGEFRYRIRKQYTEWLTLVKDKSFRAGAPLRAELMDMVNDDHDSLGHTAEAEALGFNAGRLHPDIYMNELLQGMRIIHQALPAIMKKLGMDEKDFALDSSDLYIKESSSVADGGDDVGDSSDQATTDVFELRPDDKKDTDKTPDNI